MASKSQVWEAFAAATGGSAATFAKIDRSLLDAGHSFAGGVGGGRNTKHANAAYLANLVIATGSPFPSLSGADVSAARACIYFGSVYSMTYHRAGQLPDGVPKGPFEASQLQGTSFAEWTVRQIEWFADSGTDEPHSINYRRIDFENSWIRIDFAPFAAQASWQLAGDVGLTHYFLSPDEVNARRHLAPEEAARQMSRVRRSTLLSASLLLTAAELLTDARSKQGGKLPFSGPEKASASASSENEKTPGLPGSGASTQYKAQPHVNAATS